MNPVAARTLATLEAMMDRRKRKPQGGGGTGLWLDVRRGTLVIEGWPTLLLAGVLVAARVVLDVAGGLPVPLGPEAHLGPGAASPAGYEGSRPNLAPADRGTGAPGIRPSRRAP